MSMSAQLQAIGPVILASASPRRRELLAELHVPFEVVPSDATEAHNDNLTAREICEVNAFRKARAVALPNPQSLVIGADTLVYQGTKLFGKPKDLREAERMLSELSGNSHLVVTGVCLMHLARRQQRTFSETTHVSFRSLTRDQIASYIARVHTLDKAGAYAIQENGSDIILNIEGSYSNVVGLPLERLRLELARFLKG
ncbi:MAG TPA: Maf family protein [Methylomirabilota bacterium]|nr:Maf family protein [Methylomirabilota bacterium]